jgi:hypothetical protein
VYNFKEQSICPAFLTGQNAQMNWQQNMMNRTIIIFLVVLLTACSVNSATPPASEIPSTDTQIPATNTPLTPTATSTFTATPSHTPTWTPTDPSQLLVINHDEPNLVATALSFQIDEFSLTMTAAADQIATLEAQQSTLVASGSSGGGQSSGSGSSTTLIFGYELPANVTPATITDDAFLEIKGPLNPNNVPIMQQYMPQIHLYPGFSTFIYDDLLVTDGGGRYYEVYDPDGYSIAEFYLRSRDIQIKYRGGTPNPMNYPADVVKAKALFNVIGYEIVGYDGNNKPIMAAAEPHIAYEAGDSILIHGARVYSTGNFLYYAVYDPDGKPSIYLVGNKLEMLKVWD